MILCIAVTSFAQKRTYRIGILSDALNAEMSNYVHQKLQEEIKAVVGEDAHIIFDKNDILKSDYNIEKTKVNYQKLLNRCDIIVAFGNLNALFIRKQTVFPKPVIVLGDLRDEFTPNITKTTTSGINNLMYLSYSENILDRLNILKKLTDFSKVGIVIEAHVAKVVNFNLLYNKLLKDSGIQYKIITYNTLNDIIDNLDGIDALELESSYSLTKNEVKSLSKTLIEKKIPSFSAVSLLDVKNGIMATNIAEDDFNRFFRRIALSIEGYVNGTNFSEQPVLIDFSNSLAINRETALALNIPMNYGMLGNVEFINNPEFNPKAKKVYDLPHLISEVLDKNLSLQSETKEVQISEQNIKSATSSYFPEITANAQGVYLDPKIAKLSQGSNAEWTTNGNITLQQVVFSAEANANIRIQKNLAKAQQEKFNAQQMPYLMPLMLTLMC